MTLFGFLSIVRGIWAWGGEEREIEEKVVREGGGLSRGGGLRIRRG